MSRAKQEAIDWLKFSYKGEFSELGANVALFLEEMFGLHHLSRTSLKKVDWSNNTFIEIIYDQIMSTHLLRLRSTKTALRAFDKVDVF